MENEGWLLSFHIGLELPCGLLNSGFHTKILYALLLSPFVLHALSITVFSILSPEWYLVRNTEHTALCPFRCYHVLLRPKYPSQHPILEKHQPAFLPQLEWPSFTPIQNNRQTYSSVYLIYTFLGSTLEDKRFCTEW
jgi:hypothetical protein